MTDSFDYKCVSLAEIPPLIRINNTWPELPPETAGYPEYVNWERVFPIVKQMYESGAPLETIIDKCCIVSIETLRNHLKRWQTEGRVTKRAHPRQPGKWREEYYDILRDGLLSGRTAKVIAEELHLSSDVVQKRAHMIGFSSVNLGPGKSYWVLDNPAG